MNELSEGAYGPLINAEQRVGGPIGIIGGTTEEQEAVYAELLAAGLITKRYNLTRKGAGVAWREAVDYFENGNPHKRIG